MKSFDEPLFMTNPEWYYFDEKDFCYKLTECAPEEAKESYIDHYLNCVHNGRYVLIEQGYIEE